MKNKKLFSTLVLASFLATGFIQPLSAKANTINANDILESIKKSSGKEFKMAVQNKNQKSLSGKLSKRKTSNSSEAIKFLDEVKDVLSLKDVNNNFAVKSVKKDNLGFTHVTLNQTLNGIPVDKNSITVHFNKNNVITNVTTNINERALNSSVSTAKNTSQEKALNIVKNEFKNKNAVVKYLDKKVIDKNGSLFTTYKYNVYYTSPEIGNYDVYVDINTGKIIDKENNIRYDGPVTGSGTAVNGTSRTLNLYQSGSSYQTKDTTKDMNGQILTYTANSRQVEPGTLFSSSSKTISDRAIVSAHSYAGVVYDFYKNLFNRNSIDGNGMSIKSTAHYGNKYNNAFWDGTQMVYGDGDGTQFTSFSGDLDVVAHEMTHGVTTSTADLTYSYQSGALNESMSDVFGVLIQTWDKYNVAAGGTWKFDANDWVVGDEIYTPNKPGDALRSLADPTLYNQPATMDDYYNTYSDNGGVHTNSGIPNKAAYLVAKSIGCEKTAKIYYRALTTYFNANTNFAGAYSGLVQAATDLYGADSNEVKALTSAFTSVGIISGSQQPTTDTYEPNDSISNAYTIKSGETYKSYISSYSDVDYYKIYVPRSKTLNITLSNLPKDYDLYLYNANGSKLKSSTKGSTYSESISYKTSSSGYYYIKVVGYRSYITTSPYTLKATVQ